MTFSALEEVNLVFTLMVSSTVMVDIVFACPIYMMQLLLEMAKPYKDMFLISFDYFDCTENAMQL